MSNRSLANTASVSFVVFASCVICGPRLAAAVSGDTTESVVIHGPLEDLPRWTATGTWEYGGFGQLAAAAESSRPQNPPPARISREWLSQAKGQIPEAEYEITWRSPTSLNDLPGAWPASNRAHGFRTYFTESLATGRWRVRCDIRFR